MKRKLNFNFPLILICLFVMVITGLFVSRISLAHSIFGHKQQEKLINQVHRQVDQKIEKKIVKKKPIQVCFTPGQDCTSQLIRTINQAKSQILIQAYVFTSKSIADALIRAHKRGVQVEIIFDKNHCKNRHSLSERLIEQGIIVWIDAVPGIAHNKILITDKKKVVTGSFNFSRSAQHRNAENLIFIEDNKTVEQYLQNWHSRLKQSKPFRSYCNFQKQIPSETFRKT
jgi:phosphatidylserine/phosphatidylglycerophosphate/cardiolipin synthase-like enzyme